MQQDSRYNIFITPSQLYSLLSFFFLQVQYMVSTEHAAIYQSSKKSSIQLSRENFLMSSLINLSPKLDYVMKFTDAVNSRVTIRAKENPDIIQDVTSVRDSTEYWHGIQQNNSSYGPNKNFCCRLRVLQLKSYQNH